MSHLESLISLRCFNYSTKSKWETVYIYQPYY